VRAAHLAALAAAAGAAAVLVPSIGQTKSAATGRSDACGRLEFVSGLEAVFGRRRTQAQALQLQRQVVGRGFVNANIIEGCNDFRVVVRGIETYDVGVDLQSEARRERFPVTLECIQAKPLGRWEGILGHGRDRGAANNLVSRAASVGFPGAKLRNDPCGGFEVYVAGFVNRGEAQTWAEAARSRGFADAAAELN
jgi:hypothetical protein